MFKMRNLGDLVLEASIRSFSSGKRELHLLSVAGAHKGIPEYFNGKNVELCIYWQINDQAKLPNTELRQQCYDHIIEFYSSIGIARRNHWTPIIKRVFKLSE